MQLSVSQLGSPLRIVPPEPLSIGDFWRFGERNPAVSPERDADGGLIVRLRKSLVLGHVSACVTCALGNWAEQDGRGFAFGANTAFLLPDSSIFCPDASWVRRELWTPDSSEDEYTTVLCPDFVIELRSKSDRLAAVQRKMKMWMKNGVELGWLIDPEHKVVEVYRRGTERVDVLEGATSVYSEAPVVGFILELARIWG